MAALPLEDLGTTERERRLLRRVGVVVAAVVLGATGGVGAYAWADGRMTRTETRVQTLERYIEEERSARCAVAVNVFALCLKTGVDCMPVSASCSRDKQ